MEANNNTNVPEICLLAPTDELLKLATRISKRHQLKIGLYRANITNADTCAKDLFENGAKVLISRRGVYRSLEKQYRNQVINIGTQLSDYIPIMEEAMKIKGKVAFFDYNSIRGDVEAMCFLLRIDALFYTFNNYEECQKRVKQAIENGAVLGVGGADSGRYAQEFGLPHLVVESSEQALLDGIARAQQVLRITKEEQQKNLDLRVRLERYKMVMNYTHDAILAVDEKGNVDVLNCRAEKFLRTSPRLAIGKPIKSIFPDSHMCSVLESGQKDLDQLINLHGTMVTTNRVPIVVDGKIKGAVATFQDIKTLQDSEKKIRLKLHEKGLTAKYTFSDIKGHSVTMQKCISLAKRYAKSNSTILIHGETGTGKELFAQSIHNTSSRADGPFVAINCGSLPQNLLEAELFGYVDGAYTGAKKGGKMGLFEVAHGGTIFLDEIGEMPLETQVHLLRVLQEKEIRRIGGDSVIPIDIRVVTATNRDLRKMIENHTFREDLYYRINVLNLEIAPLRDRKEDLCDISLSTFDKFLGPEHDYEDLVQLLIHKMQDYNWPGNVRELHNVIERISVLLQQGEKPSEVMSYVQTLLFAPDMISEVSSNKKYKPRATKAMALPEADEWEKKRILAALQENNNELAKTAVQLGIGRTTLWRRMKKYEITV